MKSDHFRFSKERLEAIKPPASGRAVYHDTDVKGLKLRVGPTGVKSFVVYRKVGTKPIKTTLGRFPVVTVDQARKQALKELAKMVSGIDPNKAKRADRVKGVTLGGCLDDYLRVRGVNLAESTRRNYRAMINNHLSDWATKPLREISREMIATRHQRISERGGKGDAPNPVAANNVMRVLRALFNFANGQYEGEDGQSLFPDNPVKRLSHTRAWTPEKRRQTIIKAAELPAWFRALDALRSPVEARQDDRAATVADYLEFVLFTGLRRDDALSLRWDQVDLKARVMHPVVHKKKREVMSFPLSDHVVALLQRRKAQKVNDYVFPGRFPVDEAGQHKRLDEPKKQIARVVELSGIKFSSHDLRRTFITVAESLDLSPFALKRLCSHSTGGDVTAGYVIMDVERLRAPANQIATFLLRAGGRQPSAEVVSLEADRRA